MNAVTEIRAGRTKSIAESVKIAAEYRLGVPQNWWDSPDGDVPDLKDRHPVVAPLKLEPPIKSLPVRERKIVEDLIFILSRKDAKSESYPHGEQREILELGSVAAGALSAEETPTGKKILFPRTLIPDRGPLYALRVRGDSMIGANIHAGDLAIFHPVANPQELKQGAIVVALVNGENTLKRLYRSDGGATLRAANESYSDIQVQHFDDLVIQGELRYLLKKMAE